MSTATAVPQTHELEGDDARETLSRTGWGRLARDSFERFRAADGFSHSRGLAFQFMLTAFPALIAFVGVVIDLDQKDFRRLIEETMNEVALGPTGGLVTNALEQGDRAGSGSGLVVLVGGIAALISATGAMGQIERGANRIYGIESDRATIRKYAVAALLALTVGVLILLAFVTFIAGSAIERAGAATGWSEAAVTAWQFARWPVVLVFVLAGFSMLFKMSPRRRQPSMSWLAAGAVVTVVLWFAFTGALLLYLTGAETFGDTYGPLAGIVGLLLWSLLTSVAIFVGLAFAAQLEAVRAGVSEPATDEDANAMPGVSEATSQGPF